MGFMVEDGKKKKCVECSVSLAPVTSINSSITLVFCEKV